MLKTISGGRIIARISLAAVFLPIAAAAVLLLYSAEGCTRVSNRDVGKPPVEATVVETPPDSSTCEWGSYFVISTSGPPPVRTSATDITPPAEIKAGVSQVAGRYPIGMAGPGYSAEGYHVMPSPRGVSIQNYNDWDWPVAHVLINGSQERVFKNWSPILRVVVACKGWEPEVITVRITVMSADSAVVLGVFESQLDPATAEPMS